MIEKLINYILLSIVAASILYVLYVVIGLLYVIYR